jgi:chromosome segregation ATPase
MNDVDKNTVDELKLKVRKLMDMYEETRNHNIQLREENENLKKELKQKDTELANFEERYTNMKLAKSIASVESPHDVKIKINRIVREIDKCIALLNK